jgi:hypothetical protein
VAGAGKGRQYLCILKGDEYERISTSNPCQSAPLVWHFYYQNLAIFYRQTTQEGRWHSWGEFSDFPAEVTHTFTPILFIVSLNPIDNSFYLGTLLSDRVF